MDAAEKQVMKGVWRRLNPIFAIILAPTYTKYARRAGAGVLRLDALALATGAAAWRAERGTWPSGPGALAAGLATADEVRRASAARSEPVGGGRMLEVSLPVPQGDPEKDPAPVTLRLEAR